MKKWFKTFVQIGSLILVDVAAYYVTLLLTVFVRTQLSAFIPNLPRFTFTLSYTASMYWIPVTLVVFFAFFKLYSTRYPFWEETRNLEKSLTLSLIFIALSYYLLKQHVNVLRLYFAIFWVFSIFVFPLFRFWGKRMLFRLGPWRENVIILGAGKNAQMTIKGITHESHLGYHVLGFLDDDKNNIGNIIEIKGKKFKVYGTIANFKKFVEVLQINTVFIAAPYPPDVLKNLINHVYKYVMRVVIVPDMQGVSIFNSELHYLFTEKLFMIKVHNSLNSPSNIFLKRIFDIVVASIGLILILPFILLIIFIIKLSSKGPAFYSHERIGKNGVSFPAYKFRSMYFDSKERLEELLKKDSTAKREWQKNFKLKNDPRVTPIGRFLRKTSLDELPQIFNILKGEMSLVGPRPVIQEEIDKYYADFKDYYFSVTPGLTGLWQVSGRSDTDYNFRVQTDVWYVQNWSLWLDIMILARTPFVVIRGKGAY